MIKDLRMGAYAGGNTVRDERRVAAATHPKPSQNLAIWPQKAPVVLRMLLPVWPS